MQIYIYSSLSLSLLMFIYIYIYIYIYNMFIGSVSSRGGTRTWWTRNSATCPTPTRPLRRC